MIFLINSKKKKNNHNSQGHKPPIGYSNMKNWEKVVRRWDNPPIFYLMCCPFKCRLNHIFWIFDWKRYSLNFDRLSSLKIKFFFFLSQILKLIITTWSTMKWWRHKLRKQEKKMRRRDPTHTIWLMHGIQSHIYFSMRFGSTILFIQHS